MDGILIIDKPAGPTSHDVCQCVKHALRCRRVGHTGTLDPLATGVLPLLLNAATRWAPRFAADDKEYEATARFGAATTTYDAEGIVTRAAPVPEDLRERVARALPPFRGTILQVPPPFSAVKHQGRALYRWARRGETVQAPPRTVEVRECTLLPGEGWSADEIRFRIVCGKGTYIRSLIHDLGQAVGCGAHITALRRIRSGRFHITEAIPLAAVRSGRPADPHKMLYKL
ncbi:MAG: tRNA pseudouridine(55) synthase TruB [Deltaproteobacteria bacterium]|nr:tRNA pseudouridine(55) synthase TruB [Deltaproteobacteria bacterium]